MRELTSLLVAIRETWDLYWLQNRTRHLHWLLCERVDILIGSHNLSDLRPLIFVGSKIRPLLAPIRESWHLYWLSYERPEIFVGSKMRPLLTPVRESWHLYWLPQLMRPMIFDLYCLTNERPEIFVGCKMRPFLAPIWKSWHLYWLLCERAEIFIGSHTRPEIFTGSDMRPLIVAYWILDSVKKVDSALHPSEAVKPITSYKRFRML